MAFEIIGGKITRAKKVVLYGPEGVGKSTFASRFPSPLFIDTEGSTGGMDVRRLPKPTSWSMLKEEATFAGSSGKCGTLVIDTFDWAEQLCVDALCASYGKDGIESFGYGNGYVYEKEEIARFLTLLEDNVIQKGVHVVLTAHAQLRKFSQPDELGEYDRWELKLGKKTGSLISPLLKEWADMLLFANYKTVAVAVNKEGTKFKAQGNNRVMYTQHHPCWDAKNREGFPEELPFCYESIAKAIPDISAEKIPVMTSLPVQEPEKAEDIQPPASVKYWFNGVDKVLKTEDGSRPEGKYFEITKQDYEAFIDAWDMHQKQMEQEAKKEDPLTELAEGASTFDIPQDIPKELSDLMQANGVTEQEIRKAVASRNYFPEDTPIRNYGTDFIKGKLLADWPGVLGVIRTIRDKENLPF